MACCFMYIYIPPSSNYLAEVVALNMNLDVKNIKVIARFHIMEEGLQNQLNFTSLMKNMSRTTVINPNQTKYMDKGLAKCRSY